MEEALVERLAQVLEKERKDEITALRLEAMYHKNFDRTLKVCHIVLCILYFSKIS